MCELFALSASSPVDVRLSLHELARHGGETGMHADGWGVAFLQDRDVAVFREPSAAARSHWITCLETHPGPNHDGACTHPSRNTRRGHFGEYAAFLARVMGPRARIRAQWRSWCQSGPRRASGSAIQGNWRDGFGGGILPSARTLCGGRSSTSRSSKRHFRNVRDFCAGDAPERPSQHHLCLVWPSSLACRPAHKDPWCD